MRVCNAAGTYLYKRALGRTHTAREIFDFKNWGIRMTFRAVDLTTTVWRVRPRSQHGNTTERKKAEV